MEDFLINSLDDLISSKHRSEYNSLKHGARASHGQFVLSAGIERSYGVPPPAEEMNIIGTSQDTSFFGSAKPILPKKKSEYSFNFQIERSSLSWSLEKTLCDLQIISILLFNIISSLKIANGTPPSEVQFKKITNDSEFWSAYSEFRSGPIKHLSHSIAFQGGKFSGSTKEDIFKSYNTNSPPKIFQE